MYSQAWKDSDGTLDQTILDGDKYTFSYSYYFANLTNNGLPCGGSATSTSSSAAPTSTAITCPGSDGTTVVSHGVTFLIECFVDHSGGDMGSVSVDSFQGCIDACATTPGCVDVSKSGGACYMKSSLGDAHDNGGVWGAKVVEASPTSASATSTSTSSPISEATASTAPASVKSDVPSVS